MINLLSSEDKRQLRAARTNSLLLRYVILLGILVLLLIAEMGGAWWVLDNAQKNSQQQIADNATKSATYSDTKQELANFTQNLATAKYILDQQAPYTDILLRLAAALPDGAALDRIAVDPATFGTSVTLTVNTNSYAKAIETKSRLQDSKVFNEVKFQSVVENKSQTPPYTATFQVIFSKELLKK